MHEEENKMRRRKIEEYRGKYKAQTLRRKSKSLRVKIKGASGVTWKMMCMRGKIRCGWEIIQEEMIGTTIKGD